MDITSKKWAERMLSFAQKVAEWSKDPSTKVGAVITTDIGRPVSWGFNGMPMGIDDSVEERYQRPLKYQWFCHAERNAMDLVPQSLDGCVMFVTLAPCSSCCQSIIQRGIKTVVVDHTGSVDLAPERWQKDMQQGKLMLQEAGITVIEKYSSAFD